MFHPTIPLSVTALLLMQPLLALQAVDWEVFERLRQESKNEAALKLLEQLPVENLGSPDQLRYYRELHGLGLDLKAYARAQQAGREWIALARSRDGPDELANALHSTANSFVAQGESAPARPLLEEAARLIPRLSRSELALDILISAGGVADEEADYPSAEHHLLQAEKLWQDSRAPLAGSRLWTTRANVAFHRHLLREAMEFRGKALELARQSDSREAICTSLTNLARALIDLHRYAEAIPLLSEAAECQESERLRGIILLNLGICHYELNRFDEAREAFAEMLLLALRIGNPRLEAAALGELGLVSWEGDSNSELAIDYFDRAQRIAERLNDPVNSLVWAANKAKVLRDRGSYQEALRLYEETIRRLSRIPGQTVWPTLCKGQGQSLRELKRFQEAETVLKDCLETASRQDDRTRIWEIHHQLAQLYAETGLDGAARTHFGAALDAIEDVRSELSLEDFKADFFEDKLRAYEDYAAYLIERHDEESLAEALMVAERANARSFLDSLAESQATPASSLPDEVREEERQLLGQISALQASIRKGEDPGPVSSRLKEKEGELASFYLRVRQNFEAFSEIRYPAPASLSAIQNSLNEGERLLVFWLKEAASHLWLVSRSGLEYADLPPRSELEEQIRQVYVALLDPEREPPDAWELARRVMGPLTERPLPPGSQLVIVPSGILHYFPLEVLPLGPQSPLLGERCATSYVPSASTLVWLRRSFRPRQPRMLLMGDPPFHEDGTTPQRGGLSQIGRLQPLPGTRQELLAIQSILGGSADVLLGDRAVESVFKSQQLEQYSVLHLATHGWIDSQIPSRSGLVFGPESGTSEDGILQVREIAALKLDADLVTLSACQTALGRLVTGEGMVGLTRAFFYAGTDSVVASLWDVDDVASSAFMSSFYRSLEGGRSKADALLRARVDLKRDPRFSHPYYWAPYILLGRGETGAQLPHPGWGRSLLIAGLLLGLGLPLFLLLRRQGWI